MLQQTSKYDLFTGLGRLQQFHDDARAWLADPDHPIQLELDIYYRENACHTYACLAGFCALQPWATSQGLRFKMSFRDASLCITYGDTPIDHPTQALSRFFIVPPDLINDWFGPNLDYLSDREEAIRRLDSIQSYIEEQLRILANDNSLSHTSTSPIR